MNINNEEILSDLSEKKFHSVLLFTFEDQEIICEVKNKLKYDEIKIISKADIIGKSVQKIIKMLREKKFDILLISNRNNQLNRSLSSLKILALFSKSEKQYFIYKQNIEEQHNKISLFFDIIPKIITGTILAIFSLVRSYIQLFCIDLFYDEKRNKKENLNKTIAFLRADLAGKIIAGGSLSHIHGFISGAGELGYKNYYFADYPILDDENNRVVEPITILDFFDEFQLIHYHFKLIKEAAKSFREIKPDLIYQRHTVFNASGVVLAKKFNIPLILEVNSSEVWVKKNWSRLILENLAKKFEKICLKKANVIGVVSEIIKNEILSLGASEEKIVVNPNGVDTKKFSPMIDGNLIREKYYLTDKIVVGFIGTFTKWHGVEVLFKSALEVIKESKDIIFFFIGEGNLKVTLANQTKDKKLENRIIFTGLIPHKLAPDYLAACDILVSPHLGFESDTKFFGSPTKLFEYMSMGKAIIASDLEQIGKIIIDGENGVKVQPGNEKELKEKILLVARDNNLREKLGKNARADVEKFYTWKMNAERVLSKLK